MRSITAVNSCLKTRLSTHLAMTNVSTTGWKSLSCLVPVFLGPVVPPGPLSPRSVVPWQSRHCWVAPSYMKLVTSSNFWPSMLISALCCSCCGHYFALFVCADFHSICPCGVYEFVGEVLMFTISAAHKVDVGES